MVTTTDAISVLAGFDDPRLDRGQWDALLPAGPTDAVFLTWDWQKIWWDVFGRGKLLLLAAQRDGEIIALAPLFLDGGMVFFIGSGGSDYLDFIGDLAETEVLEGLLAAARAAAPGFLGFRFYHVPDDSPTGERLGQAAERLGLDCCDEGSLPAPALDLATDPASAAAAAQKQSLLRHERALRRDGKLDVQPLRQTDAILAELPGFFAQHRARWAATPFPSLFHASAQRLFYERLTRAAAAGGWLRFTRVVWDGRPIAYHFGFNYRGSYLWYKPSFDITLARRSPGEVLLRHLLLEAMAEGAHTFDFGLGDEAFKRRFATKVPHVRTWGLYPTPAMGGRGSTRALEGDIDSEVRADVELVPPESQP